MDHDNVAQYQKRDSSITRAHVSRHCGGWAFGPEDWPRHRDPFYIPMEPELFRPQRPTVERD